MNLILNDTTKYTTEELQKMNTLIQGMLNKCPSYENIRTDLTEEEAEQMMAKREEKEAREWPFRTQEEDNAATQEAVKNGEICGYYDDDGKLHILR